jgi:hypothetical protein
MLLLCGQDVAWHFAAYTQSTESRSEKTSPIPNYSLQITSEDTLLFSNQETKAEMLEEWEVAAGFTRLIPTFSMSFPQKVAASK